MRIILRQYIVSIVLLLNTGYYYAQVTASDCIDAVNICTNLGFQISPNGVGAVNELTGPMSFTPYIHQLSNPDYDGFFNLNPWGTTNEGCLKDGEKNSTWMIINVATTGTLEMTFGAGSGATAQSGYYDWAMWTYGPNSCADITGNTLAPIRCNWNGSPTGGTGIVNNIPAGGSSLNYEPGLNVVCGDKFILCFSNYNSVSTTVPIVFTGSATISCNTFIPIVVNDDTICEGDCSNLTASGGNTYTWNSSPFLNSTTGANVQACPTSPGTYDFIVNGTGNCGSGTDTATVTVLPLSNAFCNPVNCMMQNLNYSVSNCDSQGNFDISGSVEFINEPTTGSLIVKNCSGDSVILSPPFASPMSYNITGIAGDSTSNCVLTAYFTDSTQCSIQSTAFTEPSCFCNITNVNFSFSACDTVNQTFDISGFVDFLIPPNTGQLVVKNCSDDSVFFNPPFVSPTSFTINNIVGDATQNCDLQVYFTDDTSCNYVSFPFQEPDCAQPCFVTDVTLSMDSCSLSGLHYSGQVIFQNQPSSGQLIVSDCNGNQQVFNAPFSSPITYAIHNVTPNGLPCAMTAYFTDDTLCTYSTPFIPEDVPFIRIKMDTALCVGEQVELSVDTMSGGMLVDQFTMIFNQAFSYTSTATTLPGAYYIEVSGTYTAVGMPHIRDGAFNYGAFNPPLQHSEWKWNGQNPNTQSIVPTVYNPNHIYQFYFQGGSTQNFSFSELQASWYNDNFGQLEFKIYYLGNMYWSNGVTTYSNLISPTVSGNQIIYLDYVNGCSTSDTVFVGVSDLQHTSTILDVSCVGILDGMIDFDFTGGMGTINYDWSHTTLNIDSLNGLDTGTYQLVVTDSIGCSDTIFSTVSGPQLITIHQIDTIRELCFSDCSGQMTVSSSGAYFYSIDSLNFQSDSSFSGLCGGNYIIYLRDSAGCQNTAPFTIASPSIINLTPTNDTTICINGSASIGVSGTGGTGGLQYYMNGIFSSNNQMVGLVSDSIFCYSALDSNSCRSDTHCINVTVFPPLDITPISDIDICIGDTVQVIAQVSGGDGGLYNYVWSNSSTTDSIILLSPTTTQTYTLTVSDLCETPDASVSFEVRVNTYPVADFSADILESCKPLETTFTSVISPSGCDCIWDLGDGNTSNLCGSIPYVYPDSGCYDIGLTVVSPEGCTTIVEKPQYVCSRDIPIPVFDWDPDTSTMLNTYIEFFSSSIGATSQQWELDVNGNILNFTDEEFNYTFPNFQSGTYPICLTVSNDYGCDSTICDEVRIYDHFFIYTPTGFTPGDDDLINNEFKPVIYGSKPNSYNLQVFDRWGSLVFESNDTGYGWNGNYQQTGQNCPLGVYVWRITVRDEYSPTLYDYVGNVTLIR